MALRYSAYCSEFAEAFRPMISQLTVHGLYGVTLTYMAGTIAAQTVAAANVPGVGTLSIIREFIFEVGRARLAWDRLCCQLLA